ncbi:hypothetical protein Q9G86_27085 [Bacillus thuringiensis]|uniref:hypothetical protein n=1 Tax=Bacillus thuringiensis TaxID=1428 RepID=UPI00273C2BB8|nr:hypothetical protein [Bacillus thuringiensis]WLP64235.1 hypothetical protein Q9G86_27085 [Bacillus thuringiensis]
MKVKNIEVLIDKGKNSIEIERIKNHIVKSIENMQHPIGSGAFTLYAGKKANGVKPIKDSYMVQQKAHGWILEHKLDVGVTNSRPGPIDAVLPVEDKYFAVEWETGNISSSHRAINKMIVGMLNEKLIGGILILPSRDMYDYLTDRVGNYRELSPYFDVWKKANYAMEEGYLAVVEIEHDNLTADETYQIKKGTDGRALI